MNASFVAGLRALANWYEEHPDMASPKETDFPVYAYDSKAEAASVAAVLGSCEKLYGETLFSLQRDFGGGVRLRFVFTRESVCRRKVLGTRHVPEQVTPAHEVEIVEWECEPLLESDPESAAGGSDM